MRSLSDDSRRYCPDCSYNYLADLPLCPNCAAPNVPPSLTVPPPAAPTPSTPPKRSTGKTVGAVILAGLLAFAAFAVLPSLSNFSQLLGSKDSPVNVFQMPTVQPKAIPRDQLIQYALTLINSDRANYSLSAVKLSPNEAAQIHALDVYDTKQISHWLTNGEKPYMTYTRYGGTGNVHQNVAIAGFTASQYQQCITVLSTCEVVDPVAAIKELEHQMVYNDLSCCDNGHRDNILDPHHTHVSIGIAYDKYYLAFVENFEDNYGLQTSVSAGTVHISGYLVSGTIKQVEVHYDPLPTPATYEQNKRLLSYTAGKILAAIAPPLPFGYLYKQPAGYKVISADDWSTNSDNFVNISFRLSPIMALEASTPENQAGVYTVYAVDQDNQGRLFEVTSYSIFVGGAPIAPTG